MGLSLGDLYTSGLLFLNAIAVLHEERFLTKRTLFLCAPRPCHFSRDSTHVDENA